MAIGISGYFSFLLQSLGVTLPQWMLGAPGTGPGHRVDLFAMILCLLIAVLLNRGIRSSARAETVLVAVKVTIVLAVIVVGAFYVSSKNLTPYFPFGFGGAVTGAATVFFAVFGYDAMSTAAEESKEAQRILPKAIILSLVISMGLYLLACTVLTGMQPYNKIDPVSGFSSAFQAVGLSRFAEVVAVGAIVGILTVLFSFMLGASRIWYAISRDGLLPATGTTCRTARPGSSEWCPRRSSCFAIGRRTSRARSGCLPPQPARPWCGRADQGRLRAAKLIPWADRCSAARRCTGVPPLSTR